MEFIYLFDHMNSLELLDCFADCVWDSKWEEIVKMIGGELKGREIFATFNYTLHVSLL